MSKQIFGIKTQEFLNLSKEKQSEWIEENIPEYEELCYDKGYLGAFYPCNIDLDEYLDDRDNYGVSGLIGSQDPEITEERLEKIHAGEDLTETELEHLKTAIAEADFDGWLSHHSFEIKLLNGSVFTYLEGTSIGQGGLSFEYCTAFKTFEELLKSISDQPFSYIE